MQYILMMVNESRSIMSSCICHTLIISKNNVTQLYEYDDMINLPLSSWIYCCGSVAGPIADLSWYRLIKVPGSNRSPILTNTT